MEPYERQDPPLWINHASWGEACPTMSLTDSRARTGFSRTITTHPSIHLPAGHARYPDLDVAPVDSFLRECRTEFVDCCTDPFAATIFPPEHAVFASGRGDGFLISESLWHSQIFFSDWFRNDRTTDWRWRVRREWPHPVRIAEPVNYCFHRFYFQYFHWLIDCLPRIWLLMKRGAAIGSAKWIVGPPGNAMRDATLRLFDIRPEDCIWPECPVIEFERMAYAGFDFREPIGTRPSYSDGLHHRGWWPDYLKELRERAVMRHGHPRGPSDLKIYITREDSRHRRIVNGEAVDSLLESHGFTRVTPGLLSFEEQVAIFSRAKVIVGTHGAGLTNLIWAAPGARLLEFMPAGLGDPGYRFLGQLCGHEYHCLFVQACDDPHGLAFANISVDMTMLNLALGDILS